MTYTIIMAEDNPADAELITHMLNIAFTAQCKIDCVPTFNELEQALKKHQYHCLLLDLHLPDSAGTVNVQRVCTSHPSLPVVVLTASQEVPSASLHLGAQDFLNKDDITPELLARSLRHAQERKYFELKLRKALKQAAHKNGQLKRLAQEDFLTKLPNRASMEMIGNRSCHRAKRLKKDFALIYLDLNDFKQVNDNLGHAAGDALLKAVAMRLKAAIRESDFVARLGGDEFVMLTDLLKDRFEIYLIVNRVMSAFSKIFVINDKELHTTPSIGVTFYSNAGSLPLMLKQADCAMYEAKEKKSLPVCFYTQDIDDKYARNLAIQTELKKDDVLSEFEVYFQQIEALDPNTPNSYEALLRWTSSSLGSISADEFIPIVENSPLLNQLTRFVLECASDFYQYLGAHAHQVDKIKVNVTASQLSNAGFCQYVLDLIDTLAIPNQGICLELTEREMLENNDYCLDQIMMLRRAGISIALDDFGTGYTSVKQLIDMPLDYLKIDRSLVKGICQNERVEALVAGIVEMAHRLGVKVVAEGIETQSQYHAVERLRCDYFQGYYLGRPAPCSHWYKTLGSPN